MTHIKTKRLLLRDYTSFDIERIRNMMRDRDVVQYFPNPLTDVEIETLVREMSGSIRDRGFGVFAVERKSNKEMIGIAGIRIKQYDEHLNLDEIEHLFPCVELYLLLDKPYWNQGLATEAAEAVMKFVRKKTDIQEVYAFTSKLNHPWLNVIDKIGMDPIFEYTNPYYVEGHRKADSLIFKIHT